MTNAHSLLGELDSALSAGMRALEIARRLGDLGLRIGTTANLEQAHYYRGEYERVVELATETLAALPPDWVDTSFGAPRPDSFWTRNWLVNSLAHLGRFAEAAEWAAETIELAERLGEPNGHATVVGLAYTSAVNLHVVKGDWARARALMERGIAVYRTGPIVLNFWGMVAYSARVLAQLGEAREALDRLREAEQLVGGAAMGFVASVYQALGCTCLLLGRLDEARRLADRAIKSSPHHPGYAAYGLHLLGDIATHPDRLEAESGEAYYRKALALAEPRGMRPLVAHCHLGLGKLYRRTGTREEAQEHLTTAATIYREMDMRFWLENAETAMKEPG